MALTESLIGGLGAGAGLLTGLGGIITGAIGSRRNLQAVRETNQMNWQIAQMNNEYNKQMMYEQMRYNTSMLDKQNAFSLDMWHKNNDYNSASSQRQRLEAAGLNPYLMMSGGNAGVSSNIGSSSALPINPPQAQAVSMQPAYNSLGSLGQQISNLSNPLERLVSLRKSLADVRSVNAGIRLTDANTNKVFRDNKLFDATFGTEIALKQAELDAVRATTSGVLLDNIEKNYNIAFMPTQQKLIAADYLSKIATELARGELTRNQAKHEIEKMNETLSRIFNIKADTDLKKMQYAFEDAVFQYKVDYEYFKTDTQMWLSESAQSKSILDDEYARQAGNYVDSMIFHNYAAPFGGAANHMIDFFPSYDEVETVDKKGRKTKTIKKSYRGMPRGNKVLRVPSMKPMPL